MGFRTIVFGLFVGLGSIAFVPGCAADTGDDDADGEEDLTEATEEGVGDSKRASIPAIRVEMPGWSIASVVPLLIQHDDDGALEFWSGKSGLKRPKKIPLRNGSSVKVARFGEPIFDTMKVTKI